MNCRAGEAGMCWLLNARHWGREQIDAQGRCERLQGFLSGKGIGQQRAQAGKVLVHTWSSTAPQQSHSQSLNP